MDSFLFYDIETSGLNPCFDQVLQFAAIRTTQDFKEIERYEYRVRLNPDTIPHPKAMLTTQLSVADMQQGETEYEVIKKIHALLNEPNTCSLGYNTLGFDDEFLRFSFFRNLLTPYTHQFANGCSRADIYPITLLYGQFKPHVLTWPERNGRRSYKLEDLNEANELASGQAHDAMVDVEATLALAKRLAADEATWNYALGYFNKTVDSKRFYALPSAQQCGQHEYRYGILLNSSFGNQHHYLAPALYLGQHQVYRNQAIWLRLDNDTLPEALSTSSEIPFQLLVRKKMAEAPFILPPDERYIAKLNPDAYQAMLSNLDWLNQHGDTLKEARLLVTQEPYPEIPNCDAQASLYQAGFPSAEDTRLNKRFTESDWVAKKALLDEFSNPLYYSLATRALMRSGIQLTDMHRDAVMEYLDSVWLSSEQPNDSKGKPRFDSSACLESIEECLLDHSSEQDNSLLLELKDYLIKLRK